MCVLNCECVCCGCMCALIYMYVIMYAWIIIYRGVCVSMDTFACMCFDVGAWAFVYMYVLVCLYMSIVFVCVCVCVCVCVSVWMSTYMYVCLGVYMSTCIYVVCVCIRVYVCVSSCVGLCVAAFQTCSCDLNSITGVSNLCHYRPDILVIRRPTNEMIWRFIPIRVVRTRWRIKSKTASFHVSVCSYVFPYLLLPVGVHVAIRIISCDHLLYFTSMITCITSWDVSECTLYLYSYRNAYQCYFMW